MQMEQIVPSPGSKELAQEPKEGVQIFPKVLHFPILPGLPRGDCRGIHCTWDRVTKGAREPEEGNWKFPGIPKDACIHCAKTSIHILCKPS